ncbi:MAG: hypothetical protein ACXWFI_01155 [Methylobacter sp.]
MKPQTPVKLLLFAVFMLCGASLYAQDYIWATENKLERITAVPAYDPQTKALVSVNVTLADYTVAKAANPPSTTPYTYPSFVYTAAEIAAGTEKTVAPQSGLSTVNGTMEFRSLPSSSTSTFLYVDLFYGVDVVQTQHTVGSIIEIPLTSNGT